MKRTKNLIPINDSSADALDKSTISFTKQILYSLVFALVFFIIQFLTLSDYGTSWDETLHFSRGHAYLNFFLTGKKEYPDTDRKSFYQLDYQNGDFWFQDNGGHPPINGTLAALSNYIFYQKLNILSDIHSYHLFNIFISSVAVFCVVFFGLITFGLFVAFLSGLTFVTYPLFFAEAHFNVKDPAETALYTTTALFFYLWYRFRKIKYLLMFFISFGVGLGIKFNILFLVFILISFVLFKEKLDLFNSFQKIPLNQKVLIFIGPLLILGIFFVTWPYLWFDLPNNLLSVFGYYKDIGTGTNYQPPQFYINGFNTFPFQWIVYTTSPLVLFLTGMGIVGSIVWRRKHQSVSILWLLWLIIPILRVSIPGSTIYGGSRQILEYLPALSLIAGLGGLFLVTLIRKFIMWNEFFLKSFLISLFIFPIFIVYKLHPNQNLYFNSLIGGLKGAEMINFPSWGNSYGNVYLQGINWINSNAEKNSKVALIQGTETNTPKILYRDDIDLKNSHWSGIDRKGEYLMEMTFNDTSRAFNYTWEYTDKFLIPVYEYKVEGVSVLKIWKNDLAHTNPPFLLNEIIFPREVHLKKDKDILTVLLNEEVILSKIEISFEKNNNCSEIKDSFVEISKDGVSWEREKDLLTFTQVANKSNIENNLINFYFAGKKVSAVKIIFNDLKSCGLINPKASVFVLQ